MGRPPPRTIWEFYELLHGIEAHLRTVGADRWATRIADDVPGATSGEILTTVSGDLDELVRSGVPRTMGLCAEIDVARDFARSALLAVGQRLPSRPSCE